MTKPWAVPAFAIALAVASGCSGFPKGVETDQAPKAQASKDDWQATTEAYSKKLLEEGRNTFRQDTFGSEDFWGGQLRLHQAIAGEKNGGVGPGVTPRQALQLGLKVDSAAVPRVMAEAIRGGTANLDDPATTVALLQADAVVGVRAQFSDRKITSIGVTCALCHSTVDDSFAKGIGRRLDGWPNRDLDVGAIVASAPTLAPFATLLGVDEATVRKVLKSWGPGKYDAELDQDGKAFRPDGKPAATLLPAAFGLAGVNLHTYTGWGSVPYWNAYVANTQMHGKGRFFDPRLRDAKQFPVVAKSGFDDIRSKDDRITPKLAALHYYQLSIPAPHPPKGSFDEGASQRGRVVFEGKAKCATCHVPPLFTEPGWSMHTASELGIDDFQASRSPDRKFYRTTPLGGLFTRTKGGFYHDGRFETLEAVVEHYVRVLKLDLTPAERADLVEYLKSL
jgi:cytochrome c553